MPRAEVPLVVQVPKAGADRPPLAKVGIVALVGFIIGMAWPHFTGTRIARTPPGEVPAHAAEPVTPTSTPRPATPGAGTAANVEPGPVTAAIGAAAANGTASPAPGAPSANPALNAGGGELRVTVGPGSVLRCRDEGDEPGGDCGSLQFDPIAVPVLKGLSRCNTAPAVPGTLSLGFDVDFQRQRIRPFVGKATTVPTETAQGLLSCAQTSLRNASLSDVKHRHRRYTVFYHATFAAGAEAPPPPPAPASLPEGRPAGTTTNETPATGNATVAWEAVVVRDAPRSGSIVGRVVRGTKVRLLARQGEWFRIRAGAVEGWAYRGALGL